MLYHLNLVLTAVLAGMMLSYVLVLGNFFSYLVRRERYDFFQHVYGAFRKNTKVSFYYSVIMLAQTFLALLSFLLNMRNHALLPQLVAIVIFPILIIIHKLTGYLPLEEKLNSGHALDDKERRIYLRYNLWLHFIYFLLYGGAAFLLAYVR